MTREIEYLIKTVYDVPKAQLTSIPFGGAAHDCLRIKKLTKVGSHELITFSLLVIRNST